MDTVKWTPRIGPLETLLDVKILVGKCLEVVSRVFCIQGHSIGCLCMHDKSTASTTTCPPPKKKATGGTAVHGNSCLSMGTPMKLPRSVILTRISYPHQASLQRAGNRMGGRGLQGRLCGVWEASEPHSMFTALEVRPWVLLDLHFCHSPGSDRPHIQSMCVPIRGLAGRFVPPE